MKTRRCLAVLLLICLSAFPVSAETLTFSLTTGAGTLTQTRTLSAAHLTRLQAALSAASVEQGGGALSAPLALDALVDRWVALTISFVRSSEENATRAAVGSVGVGR